MNTNRVLCGAAALALMASGMAACGDSEQAGSAPTPVVIDTDVGADDALALLAILRDPAVDVRAVTVSGTGLARCASGVQVVAGLVELAEHAPLPIACGSSKPTSGDRAFPAAWRDQADGRYGGLLPAATPPAETRDAVQLLRDSIRGARRDVTVLTLGPLTNMAQALTADPSLRDHIESVVAMAGAFRVDGNVMLDGQPGAAKTEWNMYVDPAAAQAVIDSGVPMTFVPIDSQVPVDAYMLRALASGTAPAATKAARLLGSDPFYVSGSFFLWDPLAASAVTRPAFIETRTTPMSVTLTGHEAGRTVEGSGRSVTVATVKDTDAFNGSFVSLLEHRASTGSISHEPTVSIDAAAAGGCTVQPTQLHEGPSVVALTAPMTGAAVGSIIGDHSAAEIDQYLATSPTAPPEWFRLLRLFQATDRPSATYVDLPIGNYDVLCIVIGQDGSLHATGRSVLHIS